VCVPGGEKATYAGKKRREAALDRLRDRSPSERWQSLQRTWQPFAGEQDAGQVTAAADAQDEALSAEDNSGDAAQSASDVAENDAPTATAAKPTAEPLSIHPAPPAIDERAFPAPNGHSAEAAAQSTSPVWVIDAGDNQQATDLKRSFGDTRMASLQADEQPMSPSEAMERRMAEAARLKPITEILPYHDYIPSETTDPRDLLCLDGGDSENCPQLDELPEIGFEDRLFAETYVAWEASNLFSNPLYFEDASLERYGHTHGHLLQPFVSVGKFGVQLVGLPYQMALHPVHERRYALGWYRPGEWAPKKYYLPPWNTKAAITAGAAYTGLIFLIP
jgi:hypothetical protein